jgi:hypothetical protein
MKNFEYVGGTLTLDLPDTWVQEEEDGEAVFYSDAPDSGVLRLKAQSLQNRERKATDDDVTNLILPLAERLDPEAIHEAEMMPGGQQVVSFVRRFLEDTTPHMTATWIVGMITNPHVIQIALLTYVVPAEYARAPAALNELKIVEAAAHELVGSVIAP